MTEKLSSPDLDLVLKRLHRRLTESKSGTRYAEHLSNLIGQLRHLRAGPISDIHAIRLNDLIKRSLVALGDLSPDDDNKDDPLPAAPG